MVSGIRHINHLPGVRARSCLKECLLDIIVLLNLAQHCYTNKISSLYPPFYTPYRGVETLKIKVRYKSAIQMNLFIHGTMFKVV